MIRNLKSLGLALVAVFAMSAMAASTASAATPGEFTLGAGTTTVTGTEVAAGPNKLTAFGQTVECPGSSYDIFKFNQTPHVVPPNAVTTLTVVPTYKQENCKTGIGTKMTVTTNGCDFVFHIGETTGGGETYGVTADVVCPPNVEIDVHAYASASNENITACTVTVPSQNGLTGTVHLTNGVAPSGRKDVTIKGQFTNIHVTESGLCGNKTELLGTFDVNATIEGKAGAVASDVTITD
jgi:hypothetical protein